MASKDHNDEFIRIGRAAHARVFAQPVLLTHSSEREDRVRSKLRELILAGRPDEFHGWLDALGHNWTSDDLVLHCKGMAFRAAGRFEEAELCFLRALELRRQGDDQLKISTTLEGLASCALSRKDHATAWRLLDEAVSVNPGHYLIHHNRLCLASVEGDRDTVLAVYHQMNRECPNWHDLSENPLGHALFTDGELAFLREEMPKLWERMQKRMKGEDES